MCFCGVGGWLLAMDPLHTQLKVQDTLKLEPRGTMDPALDEMVQDVSPGGRNDDLHGLHAHVIWYYVKAVKNLLN